MRGYPQFSFWISIALVKIYISYIIINRGKNTFELVGTVLKSMKLDPPDIAGKTTAFATHGFKFA